MLPQEIKNRLQEEPELISDILEAMDFHDIKIMSDKRLSSAFPDGDNKSSLQIMLGLDDDNNAYLYTISNTRDFNGGDFFSFIKWQCALEKDSEAIGFVANEIGESYTYIPDERESSDCARFLRAFVRKQEKPDSYIEEILDESVMNQFYDIPCKIFVDDGIDILAQKRFGVMYDYWDNRAVFGIRNDYGQLISVKGRTLVENYSEENIYKYMYYYNYSGTRYLYGLFENLHDIIDKDEIILIEPEKGVMQAYSFGVSNVVAISKKKITKQQIKKILSLGIMNVVIMLDKDVTEEEIRGECSKFKGLINVWYTVNTNDGSGDKDSPTDNGYNVFKEIYNEKIRYKEE